MVVETGSEKLLHELQEKYKKLTEYRNTLKWKWFQGHLDGSEKESVDDSSWPNVDLPFQWDPTKGDAWLRCEVVIPDMVEGVDLRGSKVEIFSSAMITGGEIFVDSRLVLKEKYWTDFRGPRILVTDKAEPGDKHLIAIHGFEIRPVPRGEKAGIPRMYLSYEAVDRLAFEIDSFVHELDFATLLPNSEERVERLVREFDTDVFQKDVLALVREIERARQGLSVLSDEAKRFKVYLIGHAHIDMNWLWPWDETVNVIRRDFSTVVSLMDKYPDLHFSQSQAVTYKAVEERYPNLFEQIKRKVHSGNWDITASMWVEADLNMIGSESLVRQILYSKRYLRDRFGFEPSVCWEPDTFGHIWTLPQVLKRSAINGYYFMRCGRGLPLFRWQGPDGSEVLAFNSVYNNSVTPKNIVETAKTFYQKYGLRTSMFVYGVGDHGGGPVVEDINATYAMRTKPTMPSIEFGSTHRFFQEVSGSKANIPVVNDELNFTFDGCYTTHGDTKRYNRICERDLLNAERFSVISGNSPRAKINNCWEKTLFNQFHDILDGSGYGETYAYSNDLAREALSMTEGIIKDALQRICDEIAFSRDQVSVVVFNPLPWDRKDVVRLSMSGMSIPKDPAVFDHKGKESPVQVDGGQLTFIADVPSLGYSTYYLAEGSGAEEIRSNELILENEFLKVEIDKDSAAMKSLFDKEISRVVFNFHRDEATRPVYSNLFQILHEAPHGMSAWAIGDITHIDNLRKGARIESVVKGPVFSKISFRHNFRDSVIIQEIILYSGLRRVDFRTKIDWNEIGGADIDGPMLKVSFSPMLENSVATFEIPFGSITRVPDGRETPALRWADISDAAYGVSVLNDCKHGYDVQGNTIRMTLLRTSYSPDPNPDQGHHELLYSLYPHSNDWKTALSFRKGYEIDHPLTPLLVPKPTKNNGSLPEEASFIKITPDNIVMSCLKISEDSDDVILRLYDATGDGAEAEISIKDIIGAREVDLLEKDVSDVSLSSGMIKIRMNPHEIRTVRIKVSSKALSPL